MASVKNLKKDIHYVLGDLIQAIYIHELTISGATTATSALIEDTLNSFDQLMNEVNAKGVENKKAHFKAVYGKLEEVAGQIVVKINAL